MTQPNDASAQAADRAESARRRVQELGQRLTRLAAGHGPDTGDLDLARCHAEDAAEHARSSRERARAGHRRAARAHERTALVHERAARSGAGDRESHLRSAGEHRHAAHVDEAAARADNEEIHDELAR